MYDNEDDLNICLPRILRIAIINPLVPKTDLAKKILEKTSYEYKERLKFTLYTNANDLYKAKTLPLEEQKSSKGLLDIKWFKDITQNRPCLIILYYHIDEKANLESEQQKIYNLLENIKKNDNNISIFLFIIFKDNPDNPYPFESEDKSRRYNLRNIISKEFIFVFPDEEIWRYFEFPNFCENVVFYSRQYFMKLKIIIKDKKSKANKTEEKIECNIMLGVLSTIKSKKIEPQESKYFEQAYSLICDKNFDVKNYYYGNRSPPNPKLNFCEIRSVADWIFFKTFKLEKRNIKNSQNKQKARGTSLMTQISASESELRIDRFMTHIKRFICNDYFDRKKEDCFAFVEYYWLFKRYDKLGNYIKENMKELSTNKEKLLLLGIVHLGIIYNLIKMIKYYRKYLINKDLNITKHKDNDIQIARIQNKKDNFYGKIPTYVLKDDKNPLFKEEIPFNEDLFIKKFIYDKKLSLDNMVNDLNNKYIPETLEFYQKFNPKEEKKDKDKDKDIINNAYGINLYLNILINLSCIANDKDDDNIFKLSTISKNMEQINSIIHKFDYIKKFPTLYINFLNKYNQSLVYLMNTGKIFDNIQKTQLFINLSILAYHRKFEEKEEELFFHLLNDEQFIPENKNKDKNIFINLDYSTKDNSLTDNTLMFSYEIKDIDKSQKRKIMDLIEYDFIFKTNLSKEKIKFNSMKVVFKSINDVIVLKDKKHTSVKQVELIEKEISKEELDNYKLDNNSPTNIHVKLFMKNKMNKMQVHKVIFSLCKKENIFYQINVNNDLSKLIFLNRTNKNILNLNYPLNQYVVGINQFFKFDFEVTKEIIKDITISDFKINFEAEPSYYTKEVKNATNQPAKNITNLGNNLLVQNQLSSEKNSLNINNNRNFSGLSGFSNLTAFGQQLLGQQIFNNMNNNLNNINNLNNLNMPYMMQNNINSLMVQKNYSSPNPSMANNLNIPNISNNPTIPQNNNLPVNSNNNPLNDQNRINSFSFNALNPLLFTNPMLINPNLSLQNFSASSNFGNPSVSNISTSINQIPPSKTIQVELPSPEFYMYNEENKTIDKTEKNLKKTYNDLESLLENKKNKFSILMKFTHLGTYKIKFVVTYTLKRKDIDDFYELSQENMLIFEVIEPFSCTHGINSSNFLNIHDKKSKKSIVVYLANKNISINFILKNKLHENVNIKNISIDIDRDKLKDQNKNIEINSNLLEVMKLEELDQSIKDDILTILSTAEYCIPFETKFYNDFKGKLGKIKIKWTTPSLTEFEKEIGDINNDISLINESTFDFPNIIINKLELNYTYETNFNDKKEILLNIKVENDTKKCKKIIFLIETGDEINFIISGKIKQSKTIKSKETIKFIYKLIPLQRGELKLPSLKIWEIDINNIQEKICSNYYFPQKITVI